MSKMKLTDEDIVFLVEVTRINHEMEALVELVNFINRKALGLVAEKDPSRLTPDMIIQLAKAGIDVRKVNTDLKDVLPEGLEIDEEILKKRKADTMKAQENMKKYVERKTGNILHDDDKKRGVIYVKNDKDRPDINKILDDLYEAADNRDIHIPDCIYSDKDGKKKLNAWMESGVINFIIMKDLDEYSIDKVAQFYFLDKAFRDGIKVLLKANDYNPVFPF